MLRPSVFKWTVRAKVSQKSQTVMKNERVNKERFAGMVKLSGSGPRSRRIFEQLNESKVYLISNLHVIEDFNGSIELRFMRSTRVSETNL